mmetsp:Transcript_1488/g.3235  ORF Transcript_1488/g.3235 Transcript_1488/m.3235 type:complete len:89 (+) Transcript_1488:1107-1373(+)
MFGQFFPPNKQADCFIHEPAANGIFHIGSMACLSNDRSIHAAAHIRVLTNVHMLVGVGVGVGTGLHMVRTASHTHGQSSLASLELSLP